MTKLLDRAIESVRQLPEEEQNDLAGFLLAHLDTWIETPDEEAALSEAEQEVASGQVLSEAEMKDFWARRRT